LEFQGTIDFDNLDLNLWFIRGTRSNACYWLLSVLFLLILALPFMILLNMLLTPCYCYMMINNMCNNDTRKCRRWWVILLLVFGFLALYVFIPVTFLLITVPQVVIFVIKKS